MNPGLIQIFGPIDGSFEVDAMDFGRYSASYPNKGDLDEAVDWLQAAVADCICVAEDWDLREDDERQPLLENLRDAGYNLLTEFSKGAQAEEIVESLRNATFVRARISTSKHVPLEFLYLGDPKGQVDMFAFLGTRAVIGRNIEAGTRSGKYVKPTNDASLLPFTPWNQDPPAGAAWFGVAEDRRLPSARSGAERDVFRRLGVNVSVLPSIKDNPAGWDTLDDFLEASTVLTHFNSHAVDDHPGPGGKRTSALFVTDKLPLKPDRIHLLPICEQSIVVLNCCNSIGIRFSKVRSLADAFGKRRVSVVVATTEKIGDAFGTRWAEQFYVALQEGASVGEAILKARRELLKSDGNPMALLHAFVGSHLAALPRQQEAA